MSRGLVAVVLLVVIAVTYWRPLRRVRSALGFDYLLSTGHAFLLAGFLLGSMFERTATLAEDLAPAVTFAVGWVGFAAGMRFDLRVLRAVPVRVLAVALTPAVAAALAVGGAGAGVLYWFHSEGTEARAAALVLGAAACTSGPTLVAIARTRRAGQAPRAKPVLRMLELSAGFDDLLVVVFTIVGFSLFRSAPEPIALAWLVGIALAAGALLGGVIWLFLGGRAAEDERLLLGLAMLAFIAGFGGWLHVSPAGVAAIAAMTLVNLPGDRMAQLLLAVRRMERPAVVILMTVIGFHVAGTTTWLFLPLAGLLTVLRGLAKRYAGDAVVGVNPRAPGLEASPDWGLGLVSQGTLGLVIALSFFYVWQDEVARSVLAAVALASVLNELAAPPLLVRLLKGISVRSSAASSP